MASHLSSLLVKDGLVDAEQIVRAIEHQVLTGGTLDTALLETKAIPFERLHEYLSLASGLPTLAPGPIDAIEPSAANRCPQALANEYGVVPVSWDDSALRVFVCDPVDVKQLENLATELGLALQPMIVPEYQFVGAAAKVFGGTMGSRFAALEQAAKQAPSTRLANLPHTVIKGARMESKGPFEIEPEPNKPQEPPEERVRGKRPKPEQPIRRSQELAAAEDPSSPLETTPSQSTNTVAPSDDPTPTKRPVTAEEIAVLVADPSPLAPAQVREALLASEERKDIFHLLLRGLRFRSEWAGLFVVRKNSLIGRLALFDDTIEREEISEIELGLDQPSPFKTALDSQNFFIGTPEYNSESVNQVLSMVGRGSVPATILVLPIVLSNRVAAMAVVHRNQESFLVGDVSELLPLAKVAADAMARVIVQAKKDEPATDKTDVSAPHSAAPPLKATAPRNPNSDVARLFAALEGDDPERAAQAAAQAIEIPTETVEFLQTHFPGRVPDKRQPRDQIKSVAELGPTLSLVIRMKEHVGDLLADLMGANEKDIRYYATFCAAELLPAQTLDAMVERLFDSDPDVRSLATESLLKYSGETREKALDFARRVLHSEDIERLRAAANALAQLGDASAIPDLLDVHSRGGDAAVASHRALVQLTAQDFGASNRKWRAWWDTARRENPIEWLLEGLGHKSAEVREAAVNGLRARTGQYFGFHHDLPKKEREKSKARWVEWWNETGRKKFS